MRKKEIEQKLVRKAIITKIKIKGIDRQELILSMMI